MTPHTAIENKPTAPELENRRLWEDYWRQPENAEHLERLLETYLPFARKVLGRLTVRLPSHVRGEDLLNSALIGLYGAITRFDPDVGANFETFASRRIRGAILDELRAADPLSRGQRAILAAMEKVIREWSAAHGEFPDYRQIADELHCDAGELEQLADKAQPWLSLDMPCGTGHNSMLLSEIIAADEKHPDQEAEKSEMRAILRRAFRHLSEREQKILYLYYYEELRLREIALLFDLTEARVCQIHGMAVTRLRQYILEMTQPET